VTGEANAIGTAYLRAQLLDEPHRSDQPPTSGVPAIASTGERRRRERRASRTERSMADRYLDRRPRLCESAVAHGTTPALLMSFNEVIDLNSERKLHIRSPL
jgi:hypothetical protein